MSTETKPDTSATDGKNIEGTATGAGTQTATTEEKKFTQSELERHLDQRLKEQRERIERSQKDAREKTEREAAEKKALEAGEYKQVIEAREATIADLTPKAELADRLVKTFTDQIAVESKEWPEEARDMLALAESIDKKLEALPKARALAAKLSTTSARPGNGRDPKPAGAPSPASVLDARKNELRKQGGYGRF